VYARRVKGEVLDFGHRGWLYEESFLFYDRQTDSLWVQATGEAVHGPYKGTRLERLPATALEVVGGRDMLQYRGLIIPMAYVNEVVGTVNPLAPSNDSLQVVVYRNGERTVGLVVNEIVDIIDDEDGVTSDIGSDGVSSTRVIGNRITELLDVRAAILAADPHFFDADEVGAA
jgi:hypothetical protein